MKIDIQRVENNVLEGQELITNADQKKEGSHVQKPLGVE